MLDNITRIDLQQYRRELAVPVDEIVPIETRLAIPISEDAAESLLYYLEENRPPGVKSLDLGWDIYRLFGYADGFDSFELADAILGTLRPARMAAVDRDRFMDNVWRSFNRERVASDRLIIDEMDEAHAYGWQAPPEIAAAVERLRGIAEVNRAARAEREEREFEAKLDADHAWWQAATPHERAAKELEEAEQRYKDATARYRAEHKAAMERLAQGRHWRTQELWDARTGRRNAIHCLRKYRFELATTPPDGGGPVMAKAPVAKVDPEIVEAMRTGKIPGPTRCRAEYGWGDEPPAAKTPAAKTPASERTSLSSEQPATPSDGRRSLITGGARPEIAPPEYGESELAERFVADYSGNVHYITSRSAWVHWNGKRWCPDETGHVADLVRRHCRAESALCAGTPGYSAATARGLCSDKTRNAVLRTTSIDQRVATKASDWDADPWLLGTPDGIVELKTGTLRPARPEDRVTKATSVTPAGDCPLWLAFLDKATRGEVELQAYLQRMAGYFLTGSTREESLHFAHGPGGAGKGTFAHAIEGIMGDYHVGTDIRTFTESRQDRHPAEIAVLHGARLVTASETEKGRHWAESRLKELTGRDTITARFMNGNPFNFLPSFKILISGNYRPHMRPDSAMRRRFQLIPFVNELAPRERDRKLGAKLEKEWPGILGWMIAGCVAWQRDGLNPPASVTTATEEYFEEEAEDVLTAWLHERCTNDAKAKTRLGDLYDSFKRYAERAGEEPMTSAVLGKELKRIGYKSDRTANARLVVGLRLAEQPQPLTPGQPPLPPFPRV